MKISPLDLRQAQFQLRWRGYDPLEVQQMLQLAASELETMIRDNEALRYDLQEAVGRLAEKREQEGLLKETLMEAQKSRQSLEESARKEAELVIADADLKSRELMTDAHRTLNDLYRQIGDIKKEKIRTRNEVRSAVQTLIDWLRTDEEIEAEQQTAHDGRLHFFAPSEAEEGGR